VVLREQLDAVHRELLAVAVHGADRTAPSFWFRDEAVLRALRESVQMTLPKVSVGELYSDRYACMHVYICA
jgi:hypothetical protein